MSSSFTATQIVAAAYRAVLLREADSGGLQDAASQLDEHLSIDQFFYGLLNSPEFKSRLPLFCSHYRLNEERKEDTSQSNLLDAVSSGGSAEVIHNFIMNHSAWRGLDVLAQAGDPVVVLGDLQVYRCSLEADRVALTHRGVWVHGIKEGEEFTVVVDAAATPIHVDVHTYGYSGNLLVFGPGCAMRGDFRFGGSGNMAYCSGRAGQDQAYRVALYTSSSAFVFGAESTSVGTYFHIEGPDRYIIVGRDCMLSAETYVAATDNHAILDKDTGEVLNPPEDILIGPHAWIGFGATVLKGADVGQDAVIAARALLTKSAPPGALLAGSPARVIRERVTWDRAFPSVLQMHKAGEPQP